MANPQFEGISSQELDNLRQLLEASFWQIDAKYGLDTALPALSNAVYGLDGVEQAALTAMLISFRTDISAGDLHALVCTELVTRSIAGGVYQVPPDPARSD